MAKLVITSRQSAAKQGLEKISVVEKRVRDLDGSLKTMRTLNADSRTFEADLRYVFGKNVAKARRDNKRATGALDVVIAKR